VRESTKGTHPSSPTEQRQSRAACSSRGVATLQLLRVVQVSFASFGRHSELSGFSLL
jgi:hypothetical protein